MNKYKARNKQLKKQMHNNARKSKRVKVKNIQTCGSSGASGSGDRTKDVNLAFKRLLPYQQWQKATELYMYEWSAKKIINIPVDDMLRERWTFEGLSPEQVRVVENNENELDLHKVLRQALRLERLIGGAAILMGTVDGAQDEKEPLDVNSIPLGGLKFLNIIPRSQITKVEVDTNPLSAGYGRPMHYHVRGFIVHRSRLLIFDGDPLLPVPDFTFMLRAVASFRQDGFGEPILIAMLDDLERSVGSRQAAFQLINVASILLLSTDTNALTQSKEGNKKMAMLDDIVNQVSIYRAAILDKSPGTNATTEVQTLPANFGSVPELVLTFLQILSAASDIPATRFLGEAPGGLNTDGKSSLENYYNMIGARQRNHLEPQLNKLFRVQSRSLFGDAVNPKEISYEFTPLWNASEVEEAQVRNSDTQVISSLIQNDVITPEQGFQEAQNKKIIDSQSDFTPAEDIEMNDVSDQDIQEGLNELKQDDSNNTPNQ